MNKTIDKCSLCGQTIVLSEAESVHMNGRVELVCRDCYEAHTGFCLICGDRHPFTELCRMEYGDYICHECTESDKVVFCEHCEEYALRSYAVLYDDKWWGERCASRLLVRCDECGELELRSNSYMAANGYRLCCGCYNEKYVSCECCGIIIPIESAIESDNYYYCEECKSNNRGVYDYHGFSYSNYFNKKKIDGENDDLYLGVELECDKGKFDYDSFEDYSEIHFEHEYSLSDNGVEMISLPMTLKYHQQFNWEDILSTLEGQGFRSHDTTTCGLHVHMSRCVIPATTIAKMDVFINRAMEFWSLVARRDNVYSGNYDSTKCIDLTRCIYGTSNRCPVKMRDKIDYRRSYDRYTPVNVCNTETVEIRIFRGTLKYQTFMGSIEICHAVVNWLNTIPVTRIYETEKLIREFIEYLKHNKDRYPHVMPMLELLLERSRFERLVKEVISQ